MSSRPETGSDPRSPRADEGFADRWSDLARRVGVAAEAPVVLAFSGGADSVYLLHVLAESRPRPPVWAVHVDHGLRGDEGRADLDFCARLARHVGIPLVAHRLALDPRAPSLEARAREARYSALSAECARVSCSTLCTAHQRDDVLETLLLRWIRGTDLLGLASIPARNTLAPSSALNPTESPIDVVRPLLGMSRTDLRHALVERGLAWREDSSNASARFTRNRVRNVLLPWIEAAGGRGTLDALERNVSRLSDLCAARTPTSDLDRASLRALAPIVRRRLVWSTIVRRTGAAPTRDALDEVDDLLRSGIEGRVNLRAGWAAVLDPVRLDLVRQRARASTPEARSAPAVPLEIPGRIVLGDGRELCAEWIERARSDAIPRSAGTALLDARDLAARNTGTNSDVVVRFPARGDRFHALGAAGAKPLTRFLRDAGIPREERARVPLVAIDGEIAWVAGVRPSHARRVRDDSRLCLFLTLTDAAGDSARGAG